MATYRLRSQLFIAAVLIVLALAGSLLLVIRHTVRTEVQEQVRSGTEASVRAFETVQRQRELQLSQTAALVSELPPLKGLMSTAHAPTIQDGSEIFWKLTESDLFVLYRPDQEVVALHMTEPVASLSTVKDDLKKLPDLGNGSSWWYHDGRLFWVFLHPITSGSGPNAHPLGLLAVGYQVDAAVAEQLAVVAGNQIALSTGDTIIASTLPPDDENALQRQIRGTSPTAGVLALHNDQYAFSSVLLPGSAPALVHCYVMMPMEPTNAFMKRMNLTIYIVCGLGVLFGALLFGFVSRTVTRPLDNLVAGVKALASGDFTYSIKPRGSTELVQLSTSFAQMRGQLLTLQQQRIETERMAALAQAASSISHDLRHYLAAVVANAEFLYEADELKLKKDEIYEEIKTAATQMTDLIDSLRELSSQRSSINPTRTRLTDVIRRAIEAIHAKPELRNADIVLDAPEDLEGMIDPRKLERAFFNVILNGCEASQSVDGTVTVTAREQGPNVEVRIHDQGSGIPENIRGTLFNPFVSYGKPNGTGLGLAIVSKIVHDHGGVVSIAETSEHGTTVLISMPALHSSDVLDATPTLT